MDKRLNITISFANHKEIYDFVVSQPNSSYYIRKLVHEDMEKENTIKDNNDNFDINEIISIW